MANKSIRYYAYTLPGIEEIAWLEIRERLPRAAFVDTLFIKNQQGIIVFDYAGPPEDVLALRTVDDVFVQALFVSKLSRSRRDLGKIHDLVWKGEAFGRATNTIMRFRAFSRPPTYRLNTRLVGRLPFKTKDLSQAVLAGMGKRLPRWTPQARGGQVEFGVDMLGSNLLIGARLSDDAMANRYQRHRVATTAVPPSLAAALVQLTQPHADDVFLDPLCRSGMILRERQGRAYRRLLGGDPSAAETAVALSNNREQKRQRLPAGLHVIQWRVSHLPLATAAIDKICTTLPASHDGGQSLQTFYTNFLNELGRVLRPQGTAVFLSSEYELVKNSMRHVPHLAIETGYSVLVDGRWQRIYTVSPPG